MSTLAKCFISILLIGIISTNPVIADNVKDGGIGKNVTTSVPRNMTYQGILKNSGGEPVTDTTINIIFRLYNDSTDGDFQWDETIEVSIDSSGYFDAVLSNINLPFGEDYYLELEISGDSQPLTPRQKLNMTAYSAFADTCLYAISSGSGADDDWAMDGDDIYRLDGNIGIGTSTPGNLLHIIGADSIPLLNVEQTGPYRAMRVSSQSHCAIWVEYAGNNGLRITNAANNGVYVEHAGNFAGWFNGKGYFAGDVGIGTYNPSVKLDVDGDINVSGKATIGPGHINTGDYAFVAGQYNEANGISSAISGGHNNFVAGDYSAIPGGYSNTIDSSADYSYLFGIAGSLTEDSTFMVDMPHIRFGDETNGYEFPASDGVSGQVMATDGSGQLNWVDISTMIQSRMKDLLDKIEALKRYNAELENRIAELEKSDK